MVSEFRKLLICKSLENEMLLVMQSSGGKKDFVSMGTRLQIEEDGCIRKVNGVELDEGVRRQLSYLSGSINFLFQIASDDKTPESTLLKRRMAGLMVRLLARLLQASSQEDVCQVIEEMHRERMNIKKELEERLSFKVSG